MKVKLLYFSISRDSQNKRFVDSQNIVFIEDLSITKPRAIN